MKKQPLPPGAKLYSEKAKKVFSGVRFDTYQWKQKQFDGSEATYEVVKRANSVIVIPVIDNKVVIVKERQPHWDKAKHTLIAGMIEKDEDLALAAKRELQEETGMVFDNFHLVYVESLVPGVEWFAYTFIASGYRGKTEKNLDAGEENNVVKVNFKKLIDMARGGKFLYNPRFIEKYLIQGKEGELRRVFKNPKKYIIK